ncbi:LON peptidase substrate-binding domain-containing protein [Leucobacter sp. W1038]|jgi:Lon protease-like protein|uniref:LON peptidase substrate-binding domain-containing protein n=1 Tax=Leucobacter sp. W1038 TaxID=3438281 RepID=UPI003D99B8CC
MAVVLPQFPVGSVLMPNMPVELRVFEPRYLNLMGELMTAEKPMFGIPFFGQNVEPGEAPEVLTVGTVAQIDDFGMTDDFMGITGTGTRRYVVTKWLEPEPYPRAEVEFLPDFAWEERLDSHRLKLELEVRGLLSRASTYGELLWGVDTEVSEEPVASVWQLAGMLPVQSSELHTLLASETLEDLIERTLAVCAGGNHFLDELERGDAS